MRLRRGAEETRRSDDTSSRGAVTYLMESLTDEESGTGWSASATGWCTGAAASAPSVAVDDATLAELHALVDLAPLHMPANLLAGIEIMRDALPGLAQAGLDTAFHQTMPPVAYRYAVPQEA